MMWRESAAFVAAGLMLAQPAAGFAPAGLAVKPRALERGCAPFAMAHPAGRSTRTGGTCLALRADDSKEPENYTGGDELAMRILIAKNQMARENKERDYIPMDVAVKWARQLNLWGSMEKWEEWIEENQDRHPYIPTNPEEYYKARGVWLGWRYWVGDLGDSM
jgi:hypothetical protein